MAGSKEGGRNARDTNYRLYGSDFYRRIGSIGGKKGHTGGFYANRELAREAGAKGGKISRRGSNKPGKFHRSAYVKHLPEAGTQAARNEQELDSVKA